MGLPGQSPRARPHHGLAGAALAQQLIHPTPPPRSLPAAEVALAKPTGWQSSSWGLLLNKNQRLWARPFQP